MIPGRRSVASAVAVGVAVSTLLVGCAGAPSRTSSAARPVDGSVRGRRASGQDSGSAAAVAAYRAMWKELAVASAYADPQWPQLADHADDQALRLLRHGLAAARAEDVVTKGAPEVDPLVMASGANTVRLQDCVDESHWLRYTKAGTPKHDRTGSRSRTDATVTREADAWKVTALTMNESNAC